ncbi:hypothetical protein H0H87_012110 [Tephrocybe sp. NHM501043]|nr:hypothetical protein H0H87_012110 [Tephrocybe sp. NHM501043]
MPAHYAPIPSQHDADRELDAAFEADDDDDDDKHTTERTVLVTPPREPASSIPGAYDFEREYAYDYPPPGSPPAPSAHALPNDYGNSNGLLPTSPASVPRPPRQNFFRRAVGAILPSHYVRVPTSESSSRLVVGAGLENDGVFANVVAKPGRGQTAVAEDGSIFMVPEETSQKDVPPSYAAAQADAVPPYWETTIHAPPGTSDPSDPNADMLIDDLPTGGPWLFLTNLLVSFFFQFVGFLFTYLLHTSHAAKYGSRAGLGLTLIQFGFYSRSMADVGPAPTTTTTTDPPKLVDLKSINATTATSTSPPLPADAAAPELNITSRDWLAFLFMSLGWFLVLSSTLSYFRLKRWERSIRSAAQPPTPTPALPPPTEEARQRDREIRRNLASVFGIAFDDDEEGGNGRRREETEVLRPGEAEYRERRRVEQDAQLTRDLQASGLL